MIPPRNSWYRQALGASHDGYGRVEVWRSGIKVDELTYVKEDESYTQGMPVFFKGTVQATLNSQVTRTLTLEVPEWMFPWEPTDLLNPYGQELRAFRGVRYGNGSPDEFPVFVGQIDKPTPTGRGVCKIRAVDIAECVTAAGFVAPEPSLAGTPILDEFERIVSDAYPRATFGPHDPITETVPPLAYDEDRGAALDSLVKTASAVWYTLADGRFVVRRMPWATPPLAPLTMTDGAGGTIYNAYPDPSRDGLFNRWTITSDRADGNGPMYATASDDDPASPTWVGGPMGVRSKQVRVTGATNQGQLLVYAKTLVQRTRTLITPWQVTCVPDGSLELGDPLRLTYGGRPALQYIDSFALPLGAGTMSLACRDLRNVEGFL